MNSTVGTNQHYVPAAYIARFSTSDRRPARSRRVFVRDTRAPEIYGATASQLAAIPGLYDLTPTEARSATYDHAWSGYEHRLSSALDAMADRHNPLDAALWVKVIVPFVGGLFVRGPEWSDDIAVSEQLSAHASISSNDTAQYARGIEFQFLLGPLMSLQWTVVHFPHGDLITSDVGVAPALLPALPSGHGSGPGYAIPIDRSSLLVLSPPNPDAPAIVWNGTWIANIRHIDMDGSEMARFNRSIAAGARNQIFGASPESVQPYETFVGSNKRAGLSRRDTALDVDPVCHAYDYFRVLSAIAVSPVQAQQAADCVDWSVVDSNFWTGPIVVEFVFPERTGGGVFASSNGIVVDTTYGREVRKQRKAVGDFRLGARGVVEVDWLQRNSVQPAQTVERRIELVRFEDDDVSS